MKKRWGDRIARSLDLPSDIFRSMPSLVLYGDRELILDGDVELCEYSEEKIVLNVFFANKYVVIRGRGMNLKNVSTNALSVSGVIISVSLKTKKELDGE